MAFSVKEIIKRLENNRPRTAEDVLVDCGLPLRYIGYGSFREVFHIIGTQLLVKIPIRDSKYTRNKNHARHEYRTVHSIRTNPDYEFLRPHIPAFHYFDKSTGISLVQKYRPANGRRREVSKLTLKIQKVMPELETWDLRMANFAVDRKGNLRIIDLGVLIGESC